VRLAGKVCIITRAGSGIGWVSALLFGAEGGLVVAADLDELSARETAEAVGEKAVAHRVDVADEKETLELVAQVVERFGKIDVLFNNAGISGVGDLEETIFDQWEQVMRINVRGVFSMSRAVAPIMIRQRRGSIVNMSSAITSAPRCRCWPALGDALRDSVHV
jgi:NAD(P)-dependent dehydrogenase (short-subunit alcohol dehydrogenase family)